MIYPQTLDSWNDSTPIYHPTILGSRRSTRHPQHLAQVLWRLSCGRLCHRCRGQGASQRRLGSIRCACFIASQITPNDSLLIDSVLSNPQILGVPLLLLANKQDSPLSLSVDDIRHDYEDWHQGKLESARRTRYGEANMGVDAARRERIASLDVMGISAIEGCVRFPSLLFRSPIRSGGALHRDRD